MLILALKQSGTAVKLYGTIRTGATPPDSSTM
jgi:hypothetical protein